MIPLHMGALHPIEQALVLVLAFGPFVLLGLVVWLRRRAERRADAQADQHADQHADSHTGNHADR